MKIYTKTGDTGETSLFGGARVRKDDPRIDACGEVDELNAWIGLVLSGDLDDRVADALERVQRDLFALGAQLADPHDRLAPRVEKAVVDDPGVERLEQHIDFFDSQLPPLRKFILAGGAGEAAALHVARAVCRRAERRIVALDPPVDRVLVRYVNRLSDLLFVLARAVNHRRRIPETEW
ncbi:MAG: cob(I)yrinic acid a,c-diamide adenosyltransferase [Acidobacteria bacterium]|nr:cob(I)yrinic acid a,c-diamide adenosyltransferase [Acidobacteriota bacterium]